MKSIPLVLSEHLVHLSLTWEHSAISQTVFIPSLPTFMIVLVWNCSSSCINHCLGRCCQSCQPCIIQTLCTFVSFLVIPYQLDLILPFCHCPLDILVLDHILPLQVNRYITFTWHHAEHRRYKVIIQNNRSIMHWLALERPCKWCKSLVFLAYNLEHVFITLKLTTSKVV